MTRKLYTASADESLMYCLRKMKERNLQLKALSSAEGRRLSLRRIVSQRDLIEVQI